MNNLKMSLHLNIRLLAVAITKRCITCCIEICRERIMYLPIDFDVSIAYKAFNWINRNDGLSRSCSDYTNYNGGYLHGSIRNDTHGDVPNNRTTAISPNNSMRSRRSSSANQRYIPVSHLTYKSMKYSAWLTKHRLALLVTFSSIADALDWSDVATTYSTRRAAAKNKQSWRHGDRTFTADQTIAWGGSWVNAVGEDGWTDATVQWPWKRR